MLSVATWNVLAPAYALPSRYAGVPPERLAPGFRVPRVRARLEEETDARAVVLAGDINSSFDGRTAEALRWGRFSAQRPGSTAATNGKCRELDILAARGCSASVQPTGLPPVGTA